ncbi:MAG: hypothetical protein KC731_14505 [Myxococcales bacterium]|nr:hypothetical protein [Myxococcales bacterium]
MSRLVALLVLLPAIGCTPKGATEAQLRSRATFDFECPQPEITIQDLGDRSRGVQGCGKRLTYVEVCENRVDGEHCTWVINGAPWQYGPSANKRPPTPDGTWYYSSPNPAQPPHPPQGPPQPPVTAPPGPPPAAPPTAAPRPSGDPPPNMLPPPPGTAPVLPGQPPPATPLAPMPGVAPQ